MREQLIQYVNLLFAGSADHEEMKQEILQNSLDRYDDLIAQGKSPEAAYRLAISGIGDMSEILGSAPSPTVKEFIPTVAHNEKTPDPKKRKRRAVAIGMYICSMVPLVALSQIADGIIGLCLTLLMVAAATVLLIMNSDSKDDDKEKEEVLTPGQEQRQPVMKALSTAALVLFFILSFSTGAWHITWLIFPIMAAVKGIVNAVWDLKGAKKE